MHLGSRFFLILIYIISINVFSGFIVIFYVLQTCCIFNCSSKDIQDNIFDYIIVGCGSAGAVIANRLSQNPKNQILILEAGEAGNTLLDIPSIGILLQKSPYDWQYQTVPQTNACQALDRNVSHWPMGKIIGGTSMLNNMIYTRGHEKDFDRWFENKESYNNYNEDVLPYFKSLENFLDGSKNSDGGVFLSNLLYTSILPQFVLDALSSLGIKLNEDTYNCKYDGAGKPKATLFGGQRWTSAHTLRSYKLPNVILRTGRTVEKVLFKSNFEAYAVGYYYLQEKYLARATKGIILSAGVIGSPKILMLSGIGKKQELEKQQIRTKVDLPVGENLQDHITTGFDFIMLNQTMDIGIAEMLSPISMFQYFFAGNGPWTGIGCELLVFVNTNGFNLSKTQNANDTLDQLDLQLMVMPLAIKEDDGVFLRRLVGISDHSWYNYFAVSDTPAITILPVVLHPRSRGTVKLLDNNWNSKPIIDPKYLTDSYDVDMLIRGIELIKDIVNTKSMQKLGARLNDRVFPGCEAYPFDTRPYWECYIRHMTITSYHPVGTCKMGHKDDVSSVVNFDFQVKNTNKLFVVDASVIPTLPSGNINGAIMMLAEMANEVIKRRNFFTNGKCYLQCLFLNSVCC